MQWHVYKIMVIISKSKKLHPVIQKWFIKLQYSPITECYVGIKKRNRIRLTQKKQGSGKGHINETKLAMS